MPLQIALPFYEFQEYFHGGYYVKDFYDEFEKFAFKEDDVRLILIEYKYGDYRNGKTTIEWRCLHNSERHDPNPNIDWRIMKYAGSSAFAMWWCGLTDDEDDEEEWCNDTLALQLNYGNCYNEGRHANTSDEDWTLFEEAIESDYSEFLWKRLEGRLLERDGCC